MRPSMRAMRKNSEQQSQAMAQKSTAQGTGPQKMHTSTVTL